MSARFIGGKSDDTDLVEGGQLDALLKHLLDMRNAEIAHANALYLALLLCIAKCAPAFPPLLGPADSGKHSHLQGDWHLRSDSQPFRLSQGVLQEEFLSTPWPCRERKPHLRRPGSKGTRPRVFPDTWEPGGPGVFLRTHT